MQVRSAECLFQNYIWKNKVREIFLQLREAWRPSVPGKQEYLLQSDTDGQRDGEDKARGCACTGVWLNQALLTCPASPPAFLGHHLFVASPWTKERNEAGVKARENLPLRGTLAGDWPWIADLESLRSVPTNPTCRHLVSSANLKGCFLLSCNRNEFVETKQEKNPQHTQGESVIDLICFTSSQPKISHPFIRKTEHLFEAWGFFLTGMLFHWLNWSKQWNNGTISVNTVNKVTQ